MNRTLIAYSVLLMSVLTALTLACAAALVYAGPPMLARLDATMGEALMKEGQRLEAAGLYGPARAKYAAALSARFAGPHNRSFTLKQLGDLAWRGGAYEEAVLRLREALAALDPPITAYEPLTDSLTRLGRTDEARQAADAWALAARVLGRPAAEADAQYHRGRLALEVGDRAAAYEAFLAGESLAPGGRCASELGELYWQDRRYADSRRMLDSYLARGGNPDRTARAQELLRRMSADTPP